MSPAALWYLTIFFIGLGTFNLTSKIFSNFPDKGYSFSKIFGLLILSYISWVSIFLFKGPISIPFLWTAIIILSFLSLLGLGSLKSIEKTTLKLIVVEEILFILLFSAMLWFRSSNPVIEGIEKFMDYAILNGIHRSTVVPPQDVWYSGNSINYYYFGHFSVNTIIDLSGVSPAVAFNLAVATIFSLAGCLAFSIGYALTKKLFFSFFGSFLLIAAGNLNYFYEHVFLHNSNYFYADARSLIPFTINEFPTYSFLISDLHAHILNIPYVLLFIGFMLVVYFDNKVLKSKMFLAFLMLSLGALGVTNSWDLFIYIPLLGLIIWASTRKFFYSFFVTAVTLVGATVLYMPFYLNFKPPIGGIGFFVPNLRADIGPIMQMFGFFLLLVMPFYLTLSRKKPLATFERLVLILSVYGLFLICVPEFVFVKDIYYKLNPPYFRANSIFKIWYQAWIILSLCSGFCLYKVLTDFKLFNLKVLKFLVLFIIIFFSFYVFKYTVVGTKYIVGPVYISKGLDGAAYLKNSVPGDLALIDWINENIKGQPVLLEAVGDSYTTGSLISSYTGLPTIVGWSSHELGWRGFWDPIAFRMGDVEKMYKSLSVEEVKSLISKYDVKYAVITDKETQQYGENAGQILKSISSTVAKSDNSELLKIN